MRPVPLLLRCTALAGALAAAAAGAGASEPGPGSGTTPIRLLAASLARASDLERIDFAYIALDEMGLAYREAAESALRDARTLAIGGSQARWIQATLAYLEPSVEDGDCQDRAEDN